ncbi:hypothetical protein [Streptomyces sp. NPDC020965]|uniref:hypothetical protein n=1 Tax=Streptomyces sp. NPDC020965 TaxID=3365105 RepID=UPI00379B071F
MQFALLAESGMRLGEALGLRIGDPFWRLWVDLPEPWTRVVIGDDVDDWDRITENGDRRIDPAWTARPTSVRTGLDVALAGDGRDPLRGAGHQPVREHPAPGDPR